MDNFQRSLLSTTIDHSQIGIVAIFLNLASFFCCFVSNECHEWALTWPRISLFLALCGFKIFRMTIICARNKTCNLSVLSIFFVRTNYDVLRCLHNFFLWWQTSLFHFIYILVPANKYVKKTQNFKGCSCICLNFNWWGDTMYNHLLFSNKYCFHAQMCFQVFYVVVTVALF